MVGLIVVSHGGLSRGVVDSVSMIAGDYENMVVLSLEREDSSDDLLKKIVEGIAKVDQGDGVLIFTDVFGGTPSNVSTFIASKENLYCLTGLNLPMMAEFVMSVTDDITLEELVDRCLESGREGVQLTNKRV